MTLASCETGTFLHRGHRLAYTSYGAGDRVVVLVHGFCLSRGMYDRYGPLLAGQGYRVLTLDLLGHGESDRPTDREAYSVRYFAEQVLGLLDHLDVSEAVVGGLSLGANVSLTTAVLAPQRVRGLVLEMPSAEDGLNFIVLATPTLRNVARLFPFVLDAARTTVRALPRHRLPFPTRVLLSYLDQEPRALDATTQGMLFGRFAPTVEQRRGVEVPALVIGHPGDPLHPISDARRIAEQLPHATFVKANHLLEWRFRPDRLDRVTADFLAEAWARDPSLASRA